MDMGADHHGASPDGYSFQVWLPMLISFIVFIIVAYTNKYYDFPSVGLCWIITFGSGIGLFLFFILKQYWE